MVVVVVVCRRRALPLTRPPRRRVIAASRYGDWALSRRAAVEARGGGRVGYAHVRAMGGDDYALWREQLDAVAHRDALVVDVRHNRGGNIDQWLLADLQVGG